MSGLYGQGFSPARTLSPQIRSNPDADSQYLAELLAEHQKLGPFMQVLPICSRLLNQGEIFWSLCLLLLADYCLCVGVEGCIRLGLPPPGTSMDWQGAPPSPGSYIVKKIIRLEVPVDSYPNFNFVGRILGPRGNSLKRVEASTGCRVFIRGKGSIKDTDKEEKLKGKPGYEHLNEPLHVLIEAELPANIIDTRLRQAQEIMEELLKPVDESQDFYKRQQLRELAMLNSTLREDSPHPGSVSPFSNGGMKRAKPSQ
ncbi:hypothetical protein PR202_gb12762 [Eleusine coracana subsp. coracana]|uniref:K Homology domain-containing protein n=1 Tax=Eleusine coracana subsp. coracana TaxID=191504 RepID=A0AAV5ERE2_ELECO|nr:hypothetical protein PR202_gb12762 [Eleusine coracana subsp. coracana]